MFVTNLFRRCARGPFALVALSLALLVNACGSSDPPAKPTSSAKGGASNQGGASNRGGASNAGVAGTTAIAIEEDPWVPPAVTDGPCSIPADTADPTKMEFLSTLGCRADFDALATPPLVENIPGSFASKVILDQADGDKLYFQNSKLYPIHWDFASTHLSVAQKLPQVETLQVFNQAQYSSPDRRFILGTIIYFEEPKLWALELAPIDTATAAMAEKLFRAIKAHAFFGEALVFHTNSATQEAIAAALPEDIHVKTSNQIYAGTSYLPMNLGESIGKLVFVNAADLDAAYVGFHDIVVLDSVPNNISVVAGVITEQFQTRLSHINVLASQRGTPNMCLRGATTDPELRALAGQKVRLTVGPNGYTVKPATDEEEAVWWEATKPKPVTLPAADLSVKDLRNIELVTDESGGVTLAKAIEKATLAYGAKSANYSVLVNTPGVPIKPAFAIPLYYYFLFMKENGFDVQAREMIADSEFKNSLAVQDQRLALFRTAMLNGKVNPAFQQLLFDKLKAEYPKKKMRFRTSTNAEDLNGFPCAGCYDSHSGDPDDWEDLLHALKDTWSGVWFYRTFREREYHSIDHLTVGMGMLVHTNFEKEEANGVAVTNNIYDKTGMNQAFTINVQVGGEFEIVHMEAGITSDQFLYYLDASTPTVQYISHSNLIPAGTSVLTARQAFDLALALDKIHNRYNPAYGSLSGNHDWYGMDVEFKFDNESDPTMPATLYIKQARPYPAPK